MNSEPELPQVPTQSSKWHTDTHPTPPREQREKEDTQMRRTPRLYTRYAIQSELGWYLSLTGAWTTYMENVQYFKSREEAQTFVNSSPTPCKIIEINMR